MGKILSFTVDKQKVSEGDWVVVSWNCEDPDAVSLTIESGEGNLRNIIHLGDSGSQSVTMEHPGKTVIRLNAVFNGKAHREEISIKVQKKQKEKEKKSEAKQAYYEGPRKKSFSNPFKNFGQKWTTFWQRVMYGWTLLPEKKRRIYKIIFAVILAIWFFSIAQSIGFKMGYQKGLEDAPQEFVNRV